MKRQIRDVQIKNAKHKDKPYKLTVGSGLYVHILKKSKVFRFAFRFNGKEDLITYGKYPHITLRQAIEFREQALTELANSLNPKLEKRKRDALTEHEHKNTFETWAMQWHKVKSTKPVGKAKRPWSEKHADKIMASLDNDVLPHIGAMPISKIDRADIKKMLMIIENRGAYDLCKRTYSICNAIFQYAIRESNYELKTNPVAALNFHEVFASPETRHYKHLNIHEMGAFLRALDGYGGLMTRLAFQFHILTWARPSESSNAEWSEISFDEKKWYIPADKMKSKKPHIVPLSEQAINILKAVQLLTGSDKYIFTGSKKNQPMSNGTFTRMISRLSYAGKCVPHGFRHTASTFMNESGFTPDAIERQLSHTEQNKVRGAYNHAEHMPERIKMMQWYADHLDKLKASDKVIQGDFENKTA